MSTQNKTEIPPVGGSKKMGEWHNRLLQIKRTIGQMPKLPAVPKNDGGVYDKNQNAQRKKLVTDQLEAIKQEMSLAEKVLEDQGEISHAKMAYAAAKAGLLKALNQEMTLQAYSVADAAVKQLKVAAENVLAVAKKKADRIAASQKSLNDLGPQLMPDEKNSFPAGSTRAIDKATDRTVVGHGPLFKPVLKALALVEQSAVEPQLNTLDIAAKAYLADYDRRVAEGQS